MLFRNLDVEDTEAEALLCLLFRHGNLFRLLDISAVRLEHTQYRRPLEGDDQDDVLHPEKGLSGVKERSVVHGEADCRRQVDVPLVSLLPQLSRQDRGVYQLTSYAICRPSALLESLIYGLEANGALPL